MSNPRSVRRFWCMTLNNYTEAEYAYIVGDFIKTCTYYIVAKEVGDGGTPHLQCFFALNEAKRLSELRRQCGKRCHWEVAKASGEVAAQYCKKGKQSHEEWNAEHHLGPNFGVDADFIEGGTIPSTARGLERVKVDYADALMKARKRQFAEIDPGVLIRHYSNLSRLSIDLALPVEPPKRLAKIDNLWIYGTPGSGKSWAARAPYTAEDGTALFYTKNNTKWWDGYAGEEIVIFDDLDKPELGSELKVWTDIYPFRAEYKGGAMLIRPKRFIITSNYHPDQIWDKDPVFAKAVTRRFEFVWMSGTYQPPEPVEDPTPIVEPVTTGDLIAHENPVPTPPRYEFTDTQEELIFPNDPFDF